MPSVVEWVRIGVPILSFWKNGLPHSPDGCYYPFVAGFAIKDSGIQQEYGLFSAQAIRS
ncbi:hypothetical protein J2X31_001840 [Flavobacterium arsenatis]|uniref:Uncharacterized protein n=1 Tax=Flavobacterium arsenatis TaxID=1484332 RepID=A0ABU1TPJ9_9FLAO|nr:hypothetical protein [Flavobacterium arsenatis]MDR6967826.1 hypothetical protein [Flavobacterium arsenatis]